MTFWVILHPRIHCKLLKILVGERGFEPPTPWSRTRCSTRLSHSPTCKGRVVDASHFRRFPLRKNRNTLEFDYSRALASMSGALLI